MDETDCALLEETFEQEFEDLKIQQMSVSVPGLLPRDKRPKLSDPNWDNRSGGFRVDYCRPCRLYGLDHCQCAPPGYFCLRNAFFHRL